MTLKKDEKANETFNRELEINLEDLQKKVNNNKFLKVSEWGGADVIICNKPTPSQKSWLGDQPGVVISFQNTGPRRRLVITKHSEELSWLFDQLRDIFQGRIDSGSKYDFFDSLAQAATDCLEESKGEVECKILLTKVIDAAKKYGEND